MEITQLWLLMLQLAFCKHFEVFFSPWQQRGLRNRGIYIKLSLYIVLVLYILSGEMGASTLQHTFNQWQQKERSKCLALGCSRDPFSLCALCPLPVLCYLFWCSNLSQVNNILCCLKLYVGNKKASSYCWKYLSVTFHSLSDSQIK